MKASDGLSSFNNGIDTIYESDFDDENYSGAENSVILERRRRSHTEAEQRRRNAIKKGYESLRDLVYPSKVNSGSSTVRISKLSILNKSVSDIQRLGREAHKKQEDVKKLEKVVEALRVLNTSYEDRLKDISSDPSLQDDPVSEDLKLQVFQMFAGSLFNSFDSGVTLSSFREFVSSVLIWLEDSCKPESLASLMNAILPMALPFISSNPLYSIPGAPYNYRSDPVPTVSNRVSAIPMSITGARYTCDQLSDEWTVPIPVCSGKLPSESVISSSDSSPGECYFKAYKDEKTSSVLFGSREFSALPLDNVNCPFDSNPYGNNFSVLRPSVMVTTSPPSSSDPNFPLGESSNKYDCNGSHSLRSGPAITPCRGAKREGMKPNDPPTEFGSSIFPGRNQHSVHILPSDHDSFKVDTSSSHLERFF